ncbi:putative lipoprotein [Myxococcus xanthus DK 1622]|uniref:Lipoprotein n=2 Tax=Myxococcaceae TaxID=31 RepID=Q1DF66_MYXXD|nr:putative lipoprotein [Myxococcus xanthus DK 1622]NOJ53017.1 hypothetical protein [Myxococcus xanthus]QPM80142.1 hypothetical protein I5Q59_02260 [Myxococcus xanthus]QVW69206.1 hypothetical protein JTM82_06550 [Myxococcus xanthus DZ2]UEO04666.1 hypothetical protein K1515_36260 [Myxococcus xanthus DZ2]
MASRSRVSFPPPPGEQAAMGGASSRALIGCSRSRPAAVRHKPTGERAMTKFLKTKAVLASLAAGAIAFGTACKSDSGATRETTDTTDTSGMGTMSDPNTGTSTDTRTDTTTPPGTGGTGMDDPALSPESETVDPTLNPGTGGAGTEVDPNLDPDMSSEPGTGGAGDVEPLDNTDTDEMDANDDSTLEPGTGGSGMTDPDTRVTPPTPLPETGSTR